MKMLNIDPCTVRGRRGFSLIELLVVMAVILILVSLLMPAIASAYRKARWMRVRQDVSSLHTALMAYQNEYGCWPTNMTDSGQDVGSNIERTYPAGGIEVDKKLVDLMRGQDVLSQNPRQIAFMTNLQQGATGNINAKGQFVDLAGNPYKYMLDFNYDNQVLIRYGAGDEIKLNKTVAVWSRGPDKQDGAKFRKDDIRSW
jgi:prepilin-type N-terminal cleavage/methylation domain-containing protein